MELMDKKGDKGERGDPRVVGPPGPPGPVSGGATYIQCERTWCPNITGTSLVYNGRAAYSYYNHTGGGGNYQCLPNNNPEYGGYIPGVNNQSSIIDMLTNTVPDIPHGLLFNGRKKKHNCKFAMYLSTDYVSSSWRRQGTLQCR